MLKIIIIVAFFCISNLCAISSVVYNLRIAETTKRRHVEDYTGSLATLTIFDQVRRKYNLTRENFGGALGTYIYATDSFFGRADFAVARIYRKNATVNFSRTQTDDLLFTAGYSKKVSDGTRLTFSALLGVPTHRDTSLEFVQFGYGHVGLGGQIDGSFYYGTQRSRSFRAAVRCIHFFPRSVPDERKNYRFENGNLADIFIGYHINWGNNRIEAGYNPSFYFGTKICPAAESVIHQTEYKRSSFYSFYKRRFHIRQHLSLITFALSYGFDHVPKDTGNKYIISVWTAFALNF